jgi:branched-chain amino acid transport system substrate-binding protein
MTMATAMQKANSAEPAKYLPELAKVSYDGVTGPIAFDARGDLRNAAVTLYTFRSGHKQRLTVMK